MLAVTSYPQGYINECRARTDAHLAAHRAVASAAGKAKASDVATLDELFFKDLTLLLDYYFVHRTRAMEGKDGNPLNEVRVVAASVLVDGTLTPDKSIRLRPETSVLGLAAGDTIALDAKQFTALADAFFAEIEHDLIASTGWRRLPPRLD